MDLWVYGSMGLRPRALHNRNVHAPLRENFNPSATHVWQILSHLTPGRDLVDPLETRSHYHPTLSPLTPEGDPMDPLDCIPLHALDHRATRMCGERVGVLVIRLQGRVRAG